MVTKKGGRNAEGSPIDNDYPSQEINFSGRLVDEILAHGTPCITNTSRMSHLTL